MTDRRVGAMLYSGILTSVGSRRIQWSHFSNGGTFCFEDPAVLE